VCGQRPVGWYTGRISPNTRRLVVEEGGFLYDSDSYADELPYWVDVGGTDHLVIPYTLDANDFKFVQPNGWVTADDFYAYLVDSLDQLRSEGGRMMSVGLHCRIVGRPGRARALDRFLDYVSRQDDVWVTTRAEIARHWRAIHPRR
jgi:peptidoglycan/xylan/chitin deacetylase (PgdA/CDA1 family)